MKFVEYGSRYGKLVIYFHGAPGSIEESSVFEKYVIKSNLRLVCFDRFAIDSSLDRESYYKNLVKHIKEMANHEPVDIIGFSIGSYIALEVSARLNGQVRNMHLVSPVAPLISGDYIEHMAGGLVFKLAMNKPFMFNLLTQFQKILALFAPGILVSMLFTNSAGKDKELYEQSDFRNYMATLLRQCFHGRTKGYKRDIALYVTWQGNSEGYDGSINIWHGTEDNWSPLSMSQYLVEALQGVGGINAMEGLSHYSTLYEAAPRICEQLTKS